MMTTKTGARGAAIIGVGVAGLVAMAVASAMFSPVRPDAFDYSAVPPAGAVMYERLGETEVSLAKAIEVAETTAGGRAIFAEGTFRGNAPLYEVIVYAPDGTHQFYVNGVDGKVLQDRVVPRFPGEPVEGEPITTESGLMYYDIVVGEGESPVGPNALVRAHYTGWTTDGNLVDTSRKRAEPYEFRLDSVIDGWTEGLMSMKEGGKRKLIIPFSLGYGAQGRPPQIPGRATLIFDVEVIDVVEPGDPVATPTEEEAPGATAPPAGNESDTDGDGAGGPSDSDRDGGG